MSHFKSHTPGVEIWQIFRRSHVPSAPVRQGVLAVMHWIIGVATLFPKVTYLSDVRCITGVTPRQNLEAWCAISGTPSLSGTRYATFATPRLNSSTQWKTSRTPVWLDEKLKKSIYNPQLKKDSLAVAEAQDGRPQGRQLDAKRTFTLRCPQKDDLD